MICKDCKTAADSLKTEKAKKKAHARCKGSTHCDCQHKVGPRERFIREVRD